MSSLLLHIGPGLGPGNAQTYPHYVSVKRHWSSHTRRLIKMNSTGNDGELDEMFRKEVERRKMSGSFDDIQQEREERTESSQPPTVIPPPSFISDSEMNQLQRSRELNSEGLEGLIPRGSQLLQLGVSFFLAFGPFIAVVLVAFAAVYSVFGDLFVHSGTATSLPTYYDPNELLSEPTVDPMIPL